MPAKDLQSTQALFTTTAKEVVKLIDLWSGDQTATHLGHLVKGIYHLHQVIKLSILFDLIPTFDMQCYDKKSLLNTISKVARYREAVRILSASTARLQLDKTPVEELFSQGSRLLGCLGPGKTSPLYMAGHLGIEIEYVVGLKSIEYSVEWLAGKDIGKVRDGRYPFLDAESIPSEVSLQNLKGLHIVAKGNMLSVVWHSKMA